MLSSTFRGILLRLILSASALSILILLLFQFCDHRQCYDSGPGNMGWLTLWALLFVTVSTGMLVGLVLKKKADFANNKNHVRSRSIAGFVFSNTTCLFLAYYPYAILYNTSQEYAVGIPLLIYAATVPFALSGIVASLFDIRKALLSSVCIGMASGPVLIALFYSFRTSGSVLVPLVVIVIGTATTILARKYAHDLLAKQQNHNAYGTKKKAAAMACVVIITGFFISASHPFLDVPMDLEKTGSSGHQTENVSWNLPTYYSGLIYTHEHFPTKRVEIEVDFADLNQSILQNGSPVLAGMGAQSPNCCKDGLDYGYRADILFGSNGNRYLVARAWGVCDQNVACSAMPWQQEIHKGIVPLQSESRRVALAMEIDSDERFARWYYKTAADDRWSVFSSFQLPDIENPYFNIGDFKDISPLAVLFNPPSGVAHFYQFGIASSNKAALDYGKASISFSCPAYYTIDDNQRHCISEVEPVKDGGSHWKALWKWGATLPY